MEQREREERSTCSTFYRYIRQTISNRFSNRFSFFFKFLYHQNSSKKLSKLSLALRRPQSQSETHVQLNFCFYGHRSSLMCSSLFSLFQILQSNASKTEETLLLELLELLEPQLFFLGTAVCTLYRTENTKSWLAIRNH